MRTEQDGILQAIAKFYDAGLGLGTWEDAVGYLGELQPSVAFAIYSQDIKTGGSLGALNAGFDPRALDEFDAYYSTVNVWAEGFARSPVGTLLSSEELCARDDLVRTEFYNDWLVPQDNLVSGWGSLLRNDGDRFLALSSTMPERDEARTGEKLKKLIGGIAPHVDRAVQVSRVLAGGNAKGSLQVMVDQIGEAAFVLDAAGGICCTNQTGRRALKTSGLFAPAIGALLFNDVLAQTWLAAGLADFLAGIAQRTSNTYPLRTSAGTVGECALWPLTQGRPPVPEPLAQFSDDSPAALLVLRYSARQNLLELSLQYQLTAAETEIAQALSEGNSLRQIATGRGTSIHTVRNQTRTLFDKMGVKRQSELVAKLLRNETG